MEFVLMNEAHVNAVADLEQQCFSAPWSKNAITSELTNPLSLWIVAVDGDHLAGYVGSQSVLGEADMMNIAVDPAYRRKGVGECLITELIKQLSGNEVHSLTLEVRASNDPAIKMYEKLGFVPVGRRPGYYTIPREDALIYRKEWQV